MCGTDWNLFIFLGLLLTDKLSKLFGSGVESKRVVFIEGHLNHTTRQFFPIDGYRITTADQQPFVIDTA